MFVFKFNLNFIQTSFVSTEESQLSVCECLAAIGSHSPSSINTICPLILASLTASIGDASKEISQVQVTF